MQNSVLIIGDSGLFIQYFAKHLLLQGFDVSTLTPAPSHWQDDSGLRSIYKSFSEVDSPTSYVYIFGQDQANIYIPLMHAWQSKVVVLATPGEAIEVTLPGSHMRLSIIELGDIYGPGMPLPKEPFASFLRAASAQSNIEVQNPNQAIYPVYFRDAADQIIRNSLSFSPQQNLVGHKTTALKLAQEIASITPNVQVTGIDPAMEPLLSLGDYLSANINIAALRQTIDSLKLETPEVEIPLHTITPKPKKKKFKVKVVNLKKPKVKPSNKIPISAATLIILFFIMPFSGLALSIIVLFASTKIHFLGANTALHKVAQSLAANSAANFSMLAIGPLTNPYNKSARLAEDLSKLAVLRQSQNKIEKSTQTLAGIIFDHSAKDLATVSAELSRDLYKLNKSGQYLKAGLATNRTLLGLLSPKANTTLSLLAPKLPELLGANGQREYLLLLQNSQNAAATGGSLDAFGSVTFNEGRLVSFTVLDSAVADNTLKGFVRPPEPITKHLSAQRWLFKDSNWDPNFATTGRRAQWFVDKSLDKRFDGVVALNLEFVNTVIRVTGPLTTKDGNQITSDLLSKPITDTDSLVAIYEAAFNSLIAATSAQKVAIISSLGQLAQANDLMVYLNEAEPGHVLGTSDVGSQLMPPQCTGNCTPFLTGIVEWSITSATTSQNLKRAAKLEITFDQDKIRSKLTLALTNNDSSPYEAYLRVISPPDAKFQLVEERSPGANAYKRADYKILNQRAEAGIYTKVESSSTNTLTFTWENSLNMDYTKEGAIKLLWRKQPGVTFDSAQLSVSLPKGSYALSPPPNLTENPNFSYTTPLHEDLLVEILFNNENTQP